MSADLDPLVRDLVEWIEGEPRRYADVMEAWRTSCPRLTVWEDAVERGYVTRVASDAGIVVIATDTGREFLAALRGTSLHFTNT